MNTISRAQSTFNKHVDDLQHEAVLATSDATMAEGQQGLARLSRCTCSALAAWLTALPMASMLAMKNREFQVAMQHWLGLTPLPANAVGLRCPCRAVTTAADWDHAMTCASVAGWLRCATTLLKGYCAIHRARIASFLEPTLRRLLGL
jgi:hypothetical protein